MITKQFASLAENASHGYNPSVKESFHTEARKALTALAKAVGIPHNTYTIRNNRGGIAVSGESILHSEHLYVWIQGNMVYYRTCFGQHDYVGNQTHYIPLSSLTNENELEYFIQTLKTLGGYQ